MKLKVLSKREEFNAEKSRSFDIPYGHQAIDEDDIKAVVDVLRSDYLTQGPKIAQFEKAFADFVGSTYAVSVNSGTAALHLACLVAQLGPGDDVLTSPITFVASANCALYVGANPAFIDIDPGTFNLDSRELEAHLEETITLWKNGQGSGSNARPRAVIPVHYAGLPCDMPEIWRIAKKFNLIVIEDACHALGAEYRDLSQGNKTYRSENDGWIKVGSCTHSDMTAFSFHPVKHITSGEGGMITTNNGEFYQRLLSLRNHGITRNSDKLTSGSQSSAGRLTADNPRVNLNSWYYEMQTLGYNYRISDIQCALGLSQLEKLDSFIDRRRFIAEQYSDSMDGLRSFRPQQGATGYRSSYHLYVICVDPDAGMGRDDVMKALKEMGISSQVHYIPVYKHPFYQKIGFSDHQCRNSEVFFEHCLSIPIYPAMSDDDITRVMKALREVDRMI